MTEPYWLNRAECLAIHEMMLADYGGMEGIRDTNLLESVLAKPKHLFADGTPTIFELAADYVAGIVCNRPFLDGNKRTGLMLGATFLERNGWNFAAPEVEVVLKTLGARQARDRGGRLCRLAQGQLQTHEKISALKQQPAAENCGEEIRTTGRTTCANFGRCG